MRRFILLVVPVLVLAGCGGHEKREMRTTVTKDGETTTTVTTRTGNGDSHTDVRTTSSGGNSSAVASSSGGAVASSLSIDADDFKANLEIPGMSFGSNHLDLDGMKLFPGSTVKGMHVRATDRGSNQRGQMVLNYSSPAAPLVVAQHMADQARKAGFTLTANTTALVSGTKRDDDASKDFSMTLAPAASATSGSATSGVLTMTGSES